MHKIGHTGNTHRKILTCIYLKKCKPKDSKYPLAPTSLSKKRNLKIRYGEDFKGPIRNLLERIEISQNMGNSSVSDHQLVYPCIQMAVHDRMQIGKDGHETLRKHKSTKCAYSVTSTM